MTDRALLLTPGASADRNQAALVAIDEALAPGVPVERIDLGNGRKAEAHIARIGEAAAALATAAGVAPERVVLGGRSMGGRMCSMAVAGGLRALALVLISYPLHPPGKPDRPRTAHLGALHVPCLFVSGTRDPFGAPTELEAATGAIAGSVTHVWVDGAGHGLRGSDVEVAVIVRDWVLALR